MAFATPLKTLILGLSLGVLASATSPEILLSSAYAQAASPIAAEAVTRALLDKDVNITGTIKEIIPSRGERVPTTLVLAETPEGNVAIVFWPDFNAAIFAAGELKPGLAVKVTGKLSEHRGAMQVRIRDLAQLQIEGRTLVAGAASAAPATNAAAPPVAPAATAPKAMPGPDGYFTIADLPGMSWRLNKQASVKGTITAFNQPRTPTAPYVVVLQEGPNTLEIVFWKEGEFAPDFTANVGQMIYATGRYSQYRERLQLQPGEFENMSLTPLPVDKLADLTTADPVAATTAAKEGWPGAKPGSTTSAPAAPAPDENTPLALNLIGPQHAEKTITIEGAVKSTIARPDGPVLVIGDGRATLHVVVPNGTTLPATDTKLKIKGQILYNTTRNLPYMVVPAAENIQTIQ